MEVIVMPFHSQGHMNTMLQFAKRLAFKGNGNIQITLATTLSTTQKMSSIINDFSFIRLATVYDDTDETGLNFHARMNKFKTEASIQLDRLITTTVSKSSSTKCLLVYDANMEWALDVGKKCNVMTAAFFTQGCAYMASFYPLLLQEYPNIAAAIGGGGGDVIVDPPLSVSLPTMEELEQGLPNLQYLSSSSSSSDKSSGGGDTAKKAPLNYIVQMVLVSMENLHLADWVLFNSFDHLEEEVVKWMKSLWNVRTVGPTLPSACLDKRIDYDVNYGFSLYKPNDEACMNWLNTKPAASVVYVAFGSAVSLSVDQMAEIAEALKQNPSSFLWVVRENEQKKLPSDFISETSDKGLVMSWCPQLDVLAHEAVGCFVTHCGWNSTIEAISFGVPMLGIPQFMDQFIDAEFVDQVWGVGMRLKADEKKLVTCEKIKGCLDEIMHGQRAEKIKENAAKWKAFAREAVGEGGSTDKNIDEIIHRLASS